MLIELLTLFPDFFASPFSQSMLQRAQSQGAVEFRVLNLRDFTFDRHRDESRTGLGSRRCGDAGSRAGAGPPAAQAGVAEPVGSGKRQQREPAAFVFFENPGFLFESAMSSESGGFGWSLFHPAILPHPLRSA